MRLKMVAASSARTPPGGVEGSRWRLQPTCHVSSTAAKTVLLLVVVLLAFKVPGTSATPNIEGVTCPSGASNITLNPGPIDVSATFSASKTITLNGPGVYTLSATAGVATGLTFCIYGDAANAGSYIIALATTQSYHFDVQGGQLAAKGVTIQGTLTPVSDQRGGVNVGVGVFSANTINFFDNAIRALQYGSTSASTIRNSVFRNNRPRIYGYNGGAINIAGTSVTFAGTFLCEDTQVPIVGSSPSNDTGVSGGCMAVTGTGATVIFSGPGGATFRNNKADRGIIAGNSSTPNSAGQGGALLVANDATVTFNTQLTCVNNTAVQGGCMHIIGVSTATVTLSNSDRNYISGNTATDYGGGVSVIQGANAYLNNVEVTDNTAGTFGGGVYAWSIAPQAVHFTASSIISRNTAVGSGGGLHGTYGGRFVFTSSACLQENRVINSTALGSAIYLEGSGTLGSYADFTGSPVNFGANSPLSTTLYSGGTTTFSCTGGAVRAAGTSYSIEGNACGTACPNTATTCTCATEAPGFGWSTTDCACSSPLPCFDVPTTNQTIPNAANWSASCNGTLSNETCAGSCLPGYGGSPALACYAGVFTPTGSCDPLPCTSVPSPVGIAYARPWNASCNGTASNSTCPGSCIQGASGAPFLSCYLGVFTENGACNLTDCLTQPPTGPPSLINSYPDPICRNQATYPVGTFCQATCEAGSSGGFTRCIYTPNNPNQFRNTTWSTVNCIPSCPNSELPVISNATWNCSSNPLTPAGTTCRASCSPGYGGSPAAICNGPAWRTATGNCSATACLGPPPTPNPDNTIGYTNCSGLRPFNSVCTATCSPGFTGSPSRTCRTDGTWGSLAGNPCVNCSSNQVTGPSSSPTFPPSTSMVVTFFVQGSATGGASLQGRRAAQVPVNCATTPSTLTSGQLATGTSVTVTCGGRPTGQYQISLTATFTGSGVCSSTISSSIVVLVSPTAAQGAPRLRRHTRGRASA